MPSIPHYLKTHLSKERRRHTYGVAKTARALARQYDESTKKAKIAALCHDMLREMSPKEIQQILTAHQVAPCRMETAALGHGKAAALLMEQAFAIHDPDILNAVRYHTTGRANMTPLEKILYIADKIEPNRTYPGVEELRILATHSLNQACLQIMKNSQAHLKTQGKELHPNTKAAMENLKE